MFGDAIVLHGLDNCNAKGKDLLFLLKSNKFIVLLAYFKHSNYTTWIFFNYTRSPHMIDNFICPISFFRRVKYGKVVNIRMRSYHAAILTTFKITVIKLKATKEIVAQTDKN